MTTIIFVALLVLAIIAAVFFLQLIWPIILFVLGVIAVLFIIDAISGGSALDQIAGKISAWIKSKQS